MKILQEFFFCCSLQILTHVASKSWVTVFNAYPRRDLAAVFTFGTKKHYEKFVSYGEFKRINLTSKNYDYIVEYIKPPKQDTVEDYSTFGYLSGFEEEDIQESLIIITQTQDNIEDHSILFPKINDGLSRVYFFNAMQNMKEPAKGIYVYCLYDRENFDGSRSKSILQLANDVPYGKGVENTLVPTGVITLKVFDKVIPGVSEFIDQKSITKDSITKDLTIDPQKNEYDFVILIGIYGSNKEPPRILSRYKSEKRNSSLKLLNFRLLCFILALQLLFNM